MSLSARCELIESLREDNILKNETDDYYQQIQDDKISCFMFPEVSDDQRIRFYSVFTVLQKTQKICNYIGQILSVIGVISGIFQIIILSKKSMRQSSTNILLLGIAFCDIFSMINNLKAYNFSLVSNGGSQCDPPTKYWTYQMNILIDTLLSTFRRCSPWMAVFLAIIRFSAVKFYAQSEKFTDPKIGVFTNFGILVFSSFFGVYSWFQLSLVKEDRVWKSGENCPHPNLTLPVYRIVSEDYFFGSGDIIWTRFTFWNGVFSKVVPGFLLPIFTILLLVRLAKTRNARSHVSGENSRKNRTSLLVITMATAFIISELPLGITILFQSILLEEEQDYLAIGVIGIITLFGTTWNIMATLNSVLHCAICFGLSGQYREAVAKLFGRARVEDTRTATISGQRGTLSSNRTNN